MNDLAYLIHQMKAPRIAEAVTRVAQPARQSRTSTSATRRAYVGKSSFTWQPWPSWKAVRM
jgi:hypothetical protein